MTKTTAKPSELLRLLSIYRSVEKELTLFHILVLLSMNIVSLFIYLCSIHILGRKLYTFVNRSYSFSECS